MANDIRVVKCKHEECRADLVFVMTAKGHQMPVDLATLRCASCTTPYPAHNAADSCGAKFRLAQLYDANLMVSHWGTCKNAKAFRRPRK